VSYLLVPEMYCCWVL